MDITPSRTQREAINNVARILRQLLREIDDEMTAEEDAADNAQAA